MDKCAHVDLCFNVEIQRERERERERQGQIRQTEKETKNVGNFEAALPPGNSWAFLLEMEKKNLFQKFWILKKLFFIIKENML